MVCALLSHGYSSDSLSDPIDSYLLSNQTIENLVYDFRYRSVGPSFLSKLKSSPLSTTSTILGVSFPSKYILYNSSMGSSQFMTRKD